MENEYDEKKEAPETFSETFNGFFEETRSGENQPPVKPKENFFKKVFKGIGVGGLVIGGGFISIVFYVLNFLFVAGVGLSMIWLVIRLFIEHSYVWALVALALTPIAIGLATYLFIYLLFLAVLTLIIWGGAHLFGINLSFADLFDNVWHTIYLIVMLLLAGGMTYSLIGTFVQAVKGKQVVSFLKKNWFILIVIIFLFWMFFLAL